jgi:hypothetical protein
LLMHEVPHSSERTAQFASACFARPSFGTLCLLVFLTIAPRFCIIANQ